MRCFYPSKKEKIHDGPYVRHRKCGLTRFKEININNSGDFPDVVYYIWKAAEEIRRFKSFFINLYE